MWLINTNKKEHHFVSALYQYMYRQLILDYFDTEENINAMILSNFCHYKETLYDFQVVFEPLDYITVIMIIRLGRSQTWAEKYLFDTRKRPKYVVKAVKNHYFEEAVIYRAKICINRWSENSGRNTSLYQLLHPKLTNPPIVKLSQYKTVLVKMYIKNKSKD